MFAVLVGLCRQGPGQCLAQGGSPQSVRGADVGGVDSRVGWSKGGCDPAWIPYRPSMEGLIVFFFF